MATDKVLFRGCWGSRATDNYVMCVRPETPLPSDMCFFDAAYRRRSSGGNGGKWLRCACFLPILPLKQCLDPEPKQARVTSLTARLIANDVKARPPSSSSPQLFLLQLFSSSTKNQQQQQISIRLFFFVKQRYPHTSRRHLLTTFTTALLLDQHHEESLHNSPTHAQNPSLRHGPSLGDRDEDRKGPHFSGPRGRLGHLQLLVFQCWYVIFSRSLPPLHCEDRKHLLTILQRTTSGMRPS